jgi:hypothetical protein
MCIARARVRVIYQLLRVQSYYRYLSYNRANNVVHIAAEEVVGVAVADRMMNQVGYRRNNHFHLRSLLLGILHHLCMLT